MTELTSENWKNLVHFDILNHIDTHTFSVLIYIHTLDIAKVILGRITYIWVKNIDEVSVLR